MTASVTVFLYFWLVVIVGAFFSINLTVAVISSKFSEEAAKVKAEEQAKLQALAMRHKRVDDFQDALKKKDEMSISQFITARIYAKKMIEFLRMRQEIKRIEAERIIRIKKRNEALAAIKRDVQPMNVSELGMTTLNGSLNSHSKLNGGNGANGG